jgi:hypothetical protein
MSEILQENPGAWCGDARGNRLRYGSFETSGKYAWTLSRGKAVSIAHHSQSFQINTNETPAVVVSTIAPDDLVTRSWSASA